MIQTDVLPLHERAEFHGWRRNNRLLQYVNTANVKPTRSYHIQELVNQHSLVKVLPGLYQLLPMLRGATSHRQLPCKVDIHTLTEPAHEARFTMELAPEYELELWVLIYMVSQQLHGEEGWLPTDNKTAILFGTDATIYSARYWDKFWRLNAFSLYERRKIRWPKDTLILSCNELPVLH